MKRMILFLPVSPLIAFAIIFPSVTLANTVSTNLIFSNLPRDKSGQVISQTYDEAKAWCESMHGRLPTAGELADYFKAQSNGVIEVIDSAYPYVPASQAQDGFPAPIQNEMNEMNDAGYAPVLDDVEKRLFYFKGNNCPRPSGEWTLGGNYWTSSEVEVAAEANILHPFRSTEVAPYFLGLHWNGCDMDLDTVASQDPIYEHELRNNHFQTKCVIDGN